MDGWLLAACAKLNVAVDQVLVARTDGADVVLVINRGIAGCPKYTLKMEELAREYLGCDKEKPAAQPVALSATRQRKRRST